MRIIMRITSCILILIASAIGIYSNQIGGDKSAVYSIIPMVIAIILIIVSRYKNLTKANIVVVTAITLIILIVTSVLAIVIVTNNPLH